MKRSWWLLAFVVPWLACKSGDPVPASTSASAETSARVGAEASAGASPDVVAPVAASEADKAAVAQALSIIEKGRETWYGVYVMGKKVGHGRIVYRTATDEERKQGGFVAFEMEMDMAVTGGMNANTIRVAEQRLYGKDWPYPLIASRFEQTSAQLKEQRVGIVEPAGVKISRTIDGKAEPERRGPVTKETLLDAILTTPFDLDHVALNTPRDVVSWTWEQEADEAITVTVERVETKKRAGIDEKVASVALKYLRTGITASTSIGSNGELIEMTLGQAITLKLEDQAVATSGISGLDVMGSGIKSPTPLGDPSIVDKATYEITTLGQVNVPSSPAQHVETLAPNKLRVTRVRGPGNDATPEDTAKALAADATMDSDSAAIKAKAAELTAGKDAPADKVAAIATFVYDTLDKKLATHLPTASKILEQKVGDCTEHTWLTIALLRAAGIPARPIYGVAYAGDRERSFAYHAWVEVALDGKWVWIDPTWNEARADATHLGFGDDLGAVAPSLGGVTIDSVTR